jgi:hypothetical protein
MQTLTYITGTVIIVALIGWYLTHIWSDCLTDNSFLTCARMLS